MHQNTSDEAKLPPSDSPNSIITDSPDHDLDPDINLAKSPILENSEIPAHDSKEPSPELDAVSTEVESKTPRRVKVYLLQGEDWLDNGTGYCKGEIDRRTRKPYFIVRNELDSHQIILKSFLEGSIQYQRQQETLIVWTDTHGKDLALSFQENEGCADLCDFIIKVQQENLSPMISLYYVLSTLHDLISDCPREITELVTGPITYPPESPSLDSLEDIYHIVSLGSNSHYTRACILKFAVDCNYLMKLYNLHAEAEKIHDLSSLHFLSDIVKIWLLYNDALIMDYFLSTEDNILALAGLLEYDRDYPKFKACYRDFLLDKNNFKSVIELQAPMDPAGSRMNIFRKDFVLTYLKNVVLARCIDDLALNSLSSMIYSNQMDIVNFLTDPEANDNFLQRLLHLYDDDTADLQKRRDGVKMLHQYVMMTKGQNTIKKSGFLSALVKAGFLKMIRFALEDSSSSIRTVGMESLVTVIEQDVSLVHCTHCDEPAPVDELEPPENGILEKEPNKTDDSDNLAAEQPQLALRLVSDTSFTLLLCKLLLNDEDLSLKIQAYEALRTLLSSTSMHEENFFEGSLEGFSESKANGNSHNEVSSHHRFFNTFYKTVASTLFEDFIALAGEDKEKAGIVARKVVDRPTLYQFLGDLVCFCLSEHPLDICRDFFLQNDVLAGVMEVLRLDTRITLKLAVLRCFKTAIYLNDDQLCHHIVEKSLFDQFFEFFGTVLHENNLANSSCLDLLEILTRRTHETNYKILAIHAYNDHKQILDSIDYVSTGSDLIQMVEDLVNNIVDPTATSVDENENIAKGAISSPIEQNDYDLESEGILEDEDNADEEVRSRGETSAPEERNGHSTSDSKRLAPSTEDTVKNDGGPVNGTEEGSVSNGGANLKRQKRPDYLLGRTSLKDGQVKV